MFLNLHNYMLLHTCFATSIYGIDDSNLCRALVLTTLYQWNIQCTTYCTINYAACTSFIIQELHVD